MKVFFTGDTHFGHANIIKYSKRPFANVAEMDRVMIANWNSVVRSDDVVYHLGDFCFGKRDADFHEYFHKLNGGIVFIKGNHDRLAWNCRSAFLAAHDSYLEVRVKGHDITLCHYAMRVWNKSHYGAWHLYGHSHGSLPDDPHSRSFDVGVDCHNFTPVSFEKVGELMANKIFRAIDHHEPSPL